MIRTIKLACSPHDNPGHRRCGFIGSALALKLLARGNEVVGVDNLNNYYDVRLKQARLARIEGMPRFNFVKLDLADRKVAEYEALRHEIAVLEREMQERK